MKKSLVILVILIVALLLVLIACNNGVSDGSEIPSTNLENVSIENIQVGDSIDSIDLSGYTPTDSYGSAYNLGFDELSMYVDSSNQVATVKGEIWSGMRFEVNDVVFEGDTSINVDEVTSILGDDYDSYWYDYQQSLRAYTYFDHENNIKFTLVYSNYDDSLVWVILESYQ